ncbi:RsfA family transcriptional regulator [Metabacillus idriensis]|uniref:RsfA family transcriptional regulator n=1 Tax=Metabacillus idriensis TaxID=324768 RepID=UPI00174BC172|nr:RsfA family transcriptional regulator [Metabacillus idriensis]
MTTTRQDAWTLDEDLMLAEVVLRHIRDGGTQLAAFEEVGQKLSRTAAACGFRWNSYVRKQYKSAIEMAKSQRKKVRKQETEADAVMSESMPINETLTQGLNTITFNEVISFLKSYENSANETDLKNENEKLTIRIGQLEQHIEKLQSEKETLHRNLQIVEEDYMALIEMMERARKMIVLRNDEPGRKANFQMKHNSNLEKIEK